MSISWKERYMNKAYLFGLLTVLSWSTSAAAFKFTLAYLDVLPLLFYSTLLATLLLGCFLAARGKLGMIFRLGKRDYFYFLGLGFLNPFVYYQMVFKAYDLLPAQIAQPINYTWVITLALISVPLLRQPLTRKDILSTLICYSGVVVLSCRGGAGGADISLTGIFLAFSCTLIWAFYWICNIRSRQDSLTGIFLSFLFSLPFSALACFLFSSFRLDGMTGLFGAAWIGCFEFSVPFVTWMAALSLSGNTNRVANLIFITPFLSLVFIYYVLGETISLQTVAGLAIIVSGLLIQKCGKAGRVINARISAVEKP